MRELKAGIDLSECWERLERPAERQLKEIMTIENSRQVWNRQTDICHPRAPFRAKKTMNIALLYWFGPQKNTDESQNILNRHDTEIGHFPGSNPALWAKKMDSKLAKTGPNPIASLGGPKMPGQWEAQLFQLLPTYIYIGEGIFAKKKCHDIPSVPDTVSPSF